MFRSQNWKEQPSLSTSKWERSEFKSKEFDSLKWDQVELRQLESEEELKRSESRASINC